MTIEELIAFEQDIANSFNNKEIRAPVHLYSGNEEQIKKVFEKIDIENDWVCCTWRNHYQCLLKGVPKKILKNKIIAGKSMVMNLKKYKIVSSSIVGGIPSIAVGLGYVLKGSNNKVWCWLGDMSAETGNFHEAYKYVVGYDLPVIFVIEDNGLSVTTPTAEIWNRTLPWYLQKECDWYESDHLIYYKYTNNLYPHAGAGIRVTF